MRNWRRALADQSKVVRNFRPPGVVAGAGETVGTGVTELAAEADADAAGFVVGRGAG